MFIAKITKAPHTSGQWLDANNTGFKDQDLNNTIKNTLPEAFRDDIVKQVFQKYQNNDDSSTTKATEKAAIDAIIKQKQTEVLMINKLKNSTCAMAADHGLREIGKRIQGHEQEYISFIESELSTLNIYNQLFDFSFFGLLSGCNCFHYSSDHHKTITIKTTSNGHFVITTAALKLVVACIVILMYIFCFFQLVLSSVSVDTCVRSNAPPTGVEVFNKAASKQLLTCGEIVAFCSTTYLDKSTINLSSYLAMRIFFYLFSLVPLLFLAFASYVRTATVVNRLTQPYETPSHPEGEPKTPFLNHDTIWLIAAILFSFTHILGTIFTLAADVEIVKFFGGMGALVCPSSNPIIVGTSANSTACACSALYNPSRGVFKMPDNSGFQIKQVYDVAATLLFFNLVYAIWGVLFVMGVFWKRHTNYLSIVKYTTLTTNTKWVNQVKACRNALHPHTNNRAQTHV